jgi:hypothetical protein
LSLCLDLEWKWFIKVGLDFDIPTLYIYPLLIDSDSNFVDLYPLILNWIILITYLFNLNIYIFILFFLFFFKAISFIDVSFSYSKIFLLKLPQIFYYIYFLRFLIVFIMLNFFIKFHLNIILTVVIFLYVF